MKCFLDLELIDAINNFSNENIYMMQASYFLEP